MKRLYFLVLFVLLLIRFQGIAQYTVLHNFSGTDGGYTAFNSLTISGDKLFGMTYSQGANNHGVIFSVDTDGNSYKDMIDFNGSNGAYPYASLVISGGKLYGMTAYGGANGSRPNFDVYHVNIAVMDIRGGLTYSFGKQEKIIYSSKSDRGIEYSW